MNRTVRAIWPTARLLGGAGILVAVIWRLGTGPEGPIHG
jgi:hypothetical protein